VVAAVAVAFLEECGRPFHSQHDERKETNVRQLSWLAATMLSGVFAGPVAGELFTVTSLVDQTVPDGQCSLREALNAALADTTDLDCPTSPGADVIVLDAVGTYLLAEPLVIPANAAITLRGDGDNPRNSYVLDGNDTGRIFDLQPDSSATVQHLVLTQGFAEGTFEAGGGGAIRAQEADLVLRDATLVDNTGGDGGGLYWSAFGTRQLLVEEVLISSNFGTSSIFLFFGRGGGAYVFAGGASTVRMVDVTFFNNVATNSAGDDGWAGGMLLGATQNAHVELVRNNFEVNTSSLNAGGLGLITDDSASVEILDSVFSSNYGGPAAIDCEMYTNSSLRIGRSRLLSNPPIDPATQANFRMEDGSELTLDNLLVAGGAGAGLGLFLLDDAKLLAGHLTIADNAGVGLSLADASTLTPRIESSILWNNGPGGTNDLDASGFPAPTLDSVLIGELGHPNPQFVDPANQVYELQSFSPARNAGNAAYATAGQLDANHGPRVEGPAPDLGAFEHGGIFAWDGEEGDSGAWSEVVPSSL
jgi:CSLREA domain-containing protein